MQYKIVTAAFRILGIFIFLVMLLEMFLNEKYGLVMFAAIVSTIIWVIFEKIQYEKAEYNFFEKKIEYKSKYGGMKKKEIKYRNIIEVTMSSSSFEKKYNLGTIWIFTDTARKITGRKTFFWKRIWGGGIVLRCVENVEEQYEIIKKIIEANDRTIEL